MKVQALAVTLVALSFDTFNAFSTQQNVRNSKTLTLRSTAEAPSSGSLTNDIISKLQFREAQEELEALKLDTSGTLSAMRERLRSATMPVGLKSAAAKEEVPTIDGEKLNKVSEKEKISSTISVEPPQSHDHEFFTGIRKDRNRIRRYI